MRNHARFIKLQDGSLGFFSSYDPGLVAALKAEIPYSDRRWDATQKMWIVSAHHGQRLADIAGQHLGIRPDVPQMVVSTQRVTRIVKMEYLGAAKDRGSDEPIAYGYCDDDWSLTFPLSVLRNWFCEDSKPDEAPTLYGILGVKRDIVPIELKRAYRRAALQWHPDVSDEPDAKEQFQCIQHAYEVLNDPMMRAKYDAGLKLAASVGQQMQSEMEQRGNIWRPPLRAGLLLVEGILNLGRLNVSRILKWDDIADVQGRTMISYWPRNAKIFSVRWV